MQSGLARVGTWTLEYEPAERKQLDPLTGWAGSGDTQAQVQLHFKTAAAAVAYAEARGLDYEVKPLGVHTLKLQAYADNFR